VTQLLGLPLVGINGMWTALGRHLGLIMFRTVAPNFGEISTRFHLAPAPLPVA
jgi:hypothetical protein